MYIICMSQLNQLLVLTSVSTPICIRAFALWVLAFVDPILAVGGRDRYDTLADGWIGMSRYPPDETIETETEAWCSPVPLGRLPPAEAADYHTGATRQQRKSVFLSSCC